MSYNSGIFSTHFGEWPHTCLLLDISKIDISRIDIKTRQLFAEKLCMYMNDYFGYWFCTMSFLTSNIILGLDGLGNPKDNCNPEGQGAEIDENFKSQDGASKVLEEVFIGGATLIAPGVIITAAHKVE